MARVILEFDMNEDREAYSLALKAGDISTAIQEFDNYLRHKLKYEDLPEEQDKIYQEVRDKLWECMRELDINI